MNYYPHHIGDFRSGTVNMGRQSRWIYRDMLDVYYDGEKPLPLDIEGLCDEIGVESEEERRIVERLLRFKFTHTDSGYHHERCDAVIAEYQSKVETAKANGKRGGRPRKADSNPDKPSGFQSGSNPQPNSNPDSTTLKTNQEPITSNQEPYSVPKGTAAVVAKSPADLTKEEIWSAGKSLLAEQGLPPAQCGSFIGKLVKDYGGEVVVEAVRAAVVERPANAQEFLIGACRSHGRKGPGKKASSFLNLLPQNSARIPSADDPDHCPSWMRDDLETAHV